MIDVTTKHPHGNAYGDKYEKAEGDKYGVPNVPIAQVLADEGLIESLKSEDTKAVVATKPSAPRKD